MEARFSIAMVCCSNRAVYSVIACQSSGKSQSMDVMKAISVPQLVCRCQSCVMTACGLHHTITWTRRSTQLLAKGADLLRISATRG
jgi:hypothetical protein